MSKSEMIKWGISVAIALVLFLIPEASFYQGNAKMFVVVTVFMLAITAFELLPNFIIAVLLPVLWIIFKVAPANVAMGAWASTTPFMCFGSLFLGATLQSCGLLSRVAYKMMCMVKGNYFVLLLGLMVTGILLNIITSGQGVFVLIALAYGLYHSFPEKDRNLGVGLASAVFIGTCQSHAYTYQAGCWAAVMPLAADYVPLGTVNPMSVMIHCWPLVLVSILTLYIIAKWYKPTTDLSDVDYFNKMLQELGPITKFERNNIIMVVILLVLIFTVKFTGLDITMLFGIIPFMVWLPFMKGADANTLKVFNWDMPFFTMSFMSIGVVATTLGLSEYVASACNTLLNGSNSPFLIFVVIFGLVFVLNFLMTPMAIFSLITVPICMLATQAGFNPETFLYMITASSEAIILPYEYVPYLIAYSFGLIGMKDFLYTNILRSVLFFVGFLALVIPYWYLIGAL